MLLSPKDRRSFFQEGHDALLVILRGDGVRLEVGFVVDGGVQRAVHRAVERLLGPAQRLGGASRQRLRPFHRLVHQKGTGHNLVAQTKLQTELRRDALRLDAELQRTAIALSLIHI